MKRSQVFVWGTVLLIVFVCLSVSLSEGKRRGSEKDKVKDKDGRVVLLKGGLGKVGSVRGKSKKAWVKRAIAYLETPRVRRKMGIKTPPNKHEEIRKGDKRGLRKVVVFDKKKKIVHVFLQAFLYGRKVYGGELEVHIKKRSKKVFSASGNRLLVSEVKKSGEGKKPKISAKQALRKGLKALRKRKGIKGKSVKLRKKGAGQKGELCYVYDRKDKGRLVYRFLVKYKEKKGPQRSSIFVSAHTGKIVVERVEIALARNRNTRNSNHGTSTGTLILSESSPLSTTNDQSIRNAHIHTGTTYDFFKSKFNRDGINGAGMVMHSNVHVRSNYNNAYWWSNQLWYGDGDGVNFADFASDITVVAHEFAHGVTQFTAGLVYSYESGALNEGTSDIFGACVRMQSEGVNNWKIGDKCKRPVGTTLRNMADPASNGDRDYYPHRYTGSQDHGGVHWNSGIANLFFVKLSDGGSHPRGKAAGVSVVGITWAKAVRIWYRALDLYFPNSCTFALARSHTVTAATDLYGAASREVHSVKMAWHLVGVGANPGPFGSSSQACVGGHGWQHVAGKLKHFSVNSQGQTAGVNVHDDIYFDRAWPPGNWQHIGGKLMYISSGTGGTPAWGVNSNHDIFHYTSQWNHVGGKLKGVSVSANGAHVWGVNSNDDIFYWSNGWHHVGGKLKQISACADGAVWGVNSNDDIYYRPAPASSTNWVHVGGKLKHVSCGADVNSVWGVNSNDDIFYRYSGTWHHVAGKLKQISTGARGFVVGVNSNDDIFYRTFAAGC